MGKRLQRLAKNKTDLVPKNASCKRWDTPKVSGRNSRKEHAIMSGRFHVVTWNGGGNTTPIYALARRLVARGHEVTLLGQSAQAEAARDLRARFVPLGVPAWTPGKS